jgi:hypothetical protein
MTWIRAVLACVFLAASAASLFAEEEADEPVGPVYVPDESQDGAPSEPPATCEGQDCLPATDNPVQECRGLDCMPAPHEE